MFNLLFVHTQILIIVVFNQIFKIDEHADELPTSPGRFLRINAEVMQGRITQFETALRRMTGKDEVGGKSKRQKRAKDKKERSSNSPDVKVEEEVQSPKKGICLFAET